MQRNLIVLMFLISGMAGLTYEVVWVRMLTLVFGTTTYAVSTVLFSFMAGLALGSYLFGRIVDSIRSPLVLYAMLELGIGLSALFVPHAIEYLNTTYVSLFDENLPNPFVYSSLRFVFSMTVLLVPTTLMGATLPVLSRYFVRNLGTVGWDVGILYTINTLGAVIGALVAGYYLEATFGVSMTINIAATANLVAAIMAGLIFWKSGAQKQQWQPETTRAATTPSGNPAAKTAYTHPAVIFWVFAVSGFCAIGFEVIWFRTLLLALFNTTYAFTSMLVAFLAGLTIGSYLISRILDERYNWPLILGYTLISIGVISALTAPLFILYHNVSFLDMRDAYAGSFHRVTAAGFYLSGVLMLVPTVAMGLTLPLANKIYIDSISNVGNKIGKLYAINTLGGVLGSFVAGFLLVPAIGIIKTGLTLAAFYILAGLAVLYFTPASLLLRRLTYLAVVILALSTAGSITATDWPGKLHVSMARGINTLSYREGASSTVTIVELQGTRAAFVNGNIVVGATPGAKQTVRLLAHLPVLLQKEATSAVIIGFGMGITTYSLSLHELTPTDVVEIAPEILESAGYFSDVNHGVHDNPHINVIVEDGRNYLLRTRKKYSVITADPTHPILGSGNLYTREYYEQAYQKLESDGIIVQYVPLHLLQNPEFRILINTFNSVFEHSSLWFSSSDLVIMGSKQPLIIDYAKLEQKLHDPVVSADLELSHMETAPTLLGQMLLGNEEIRKYAANSAINTDDKPIIEFRGPSSIGKNTRGNNLESILPHLSNTIDYVDLSGLSPVEQSKARAILTKKDRRKRYILRGLMHDSRKEYGLAINEYRSGLRLFPDDADAQRLLKDARKRIANINH